MMAVMVMVMLVIMMVVVIFMLVRSFRRGRSALHERGFLSRPEFRRHLKRGRSHR